MKGLTFEYEMKYRAQVLRILGVDIPFATGEPQTFKSSTDRFTPDKSLPMRYHIAKSERTKVDIATYMRSGVQDDPAFEVRTHKELTFIKIRLIYSFRTSLPVSRTIALPAS